MPQESICINKFQKNNITKELKSIQKFERTLVDNGYIVIKFFFHISQLEQATRTHKLFEKQEYKMACQ